MKKKKAYWYLYKFSDDSSIYCKCTNCNWVIPVSTVDYFNKDDEYKQIYINYIPKYCQECGRKNILYNGYVVYRYDQDGHFMPGKEAPFPHKIVTER